MVVCDDSCRKLLQQANNADGEETSLRARMVLRHSSHWPVTCCFLGPAQSSGLEGRLWRCRRLDDGAVVPMEVSGLQLMTLNRPLRDWKDEFCALEKELRSLVSQGEWVTTGTWKMSAKMGVFTGGA